MANGEWRGQLRLQMRLANATYLSCTERYQTGTGKMRGKPPASGAGVHIAISGVQVCRYAGKQTSRQAGTLQAGTTYKPVQAVKQISISAGKYRVGTYKFTIL